MIGLDAVVLIALEHVSRSWHGILDHARVHRGAVRRDLDWRRAVLERTGEELTRSTGIAAFGDQDVDDLPMLVYRAVEVGPAAGDLEVGFVDEPPIAGGVPAGRAASMNSAVEVWTQRDTVT